MQLQDNQPNNPLHGITLKSIVTALAEHYGWEELAQRILVNCFMNDPSINSSLKFLRQTPWAREKVEQLYVKTLLPVQIDNLWPIFMCSNFQPIKRDHGIWVKQQFGCELPDSPWREESYPTYPAPFIYLNDGKPRCDLAQFGLVPHWAKDKKKFGLKTYNARSETIQEKPSYRSAWKERRFGLVLMESFYEPNWETGKALRWRIKRFDGQPIAVASIWERFVDKKTGEIITSFSMLTINAEGHEVMKHFHKPEDEKRSIVVLQETEYDQWLHASHDEARSLLSLAAPGFLESESAPR